MDVCIVNVCSSFRATIWPQCQHKHARALAGLLLLLLLVFVAEVGVTPPSSSASSSLLLHPLAGLGGVLALLRGTTLGDAKHRLQPRPNLPFPSPSKLLVQKGQIVPYVAKGRP